jgi:hypothetical protein
MDMYTIKKLVTRHTAFASKPAPTRCRIHPQDHPR